MAGTDYKFYMSRLIDGTWEQEISIEDYFPGLKYLNCSGLSDYGAVKNIYTEDYAETEELRLYLPDTPVREATEIEFEFGFINENRRDTYDSFVDWITGYRIKYWDTCRYREVEMVLTEALEVDDDDLYGSCPFIAIPFTFQNLYGRTTKHEVADGGGEDENLLWDNSDPVLWDNYLTIGI